MKTFSILIISLFLVLQMCGQTQTVGLFLNDSLAFEGYNLLVPNSYHETKLIDNCGQVVNTWTHDDSPGLSAYLLENGNLLRTNYITSTFGAGGTGGRVTIQDWDNNMLWDFTYSTNSHHHHHDIEYMPNGNVLLLAWVRHTREDAIEMGRDTNLVASQFWTEKIIEIQPIGEDSGTIVWEWHLKDHLVQDFDSTKSNFGVIADHPELVNINYVHNQSPDWIHLNSVDYNPILDQIMVNSRHISELWVIDHSTTTAEAAGHTGGNSGKGGDVLYRWGNPATYDRGDYTDQRLYFPHDCHWIEEGLPDAGKIMMFNNGQSRPQGNFSTVEVITPPVDSLGNYTISDTAAFGPKVLEWIYPEIFDPQFFSANVSGAQRLPNGNTLICEGASGHVFEVTSDQQIVWDYVNPLSGFGPIPQGGNPVVNSLFRMYRYGADYPAFDGRDMTPGDVIELNPTDTICHNDSPLSIDNFYDENEINFSAYIVNDQLIIENPSSEKVRIQLFDLMGRRVLRQEIYTNTTNISLPDLPIGIYYLNFATAKKLVFTQKLLKK